MKRFLYSFLGLSVLIGCLYPMQIFSQSTANKKQTVRLATKAEAEKLLASEDSYTLNWNEFDINSRLEKTDGSGTKEELLQLAAQETLDWTEEEKEKMERAVDLFNKDIASHHFQLPFPKEIILIKSTMKDEGEAGGYTRNNWIVLSDKRLQATEERIKRILTHELFHVLTRMNPSFKKKMYETIGFTVLDEELEFPADLKNVRMSNPDVSKYDSYGVFTVDNEKKKCSMILYTDRPYTGGRFYLYFKIGFVPLDENLKPIRENGKTKMYTLEDMTDFYEVVGRNTNYIINPEEILAENFVFAVLDVPDLPNPELKNKIQSLLKQTL